MTVVIFFSSMKVMKRNQRQRDEEKENGGGMLDGQMLWFIMHQLRRGRRRVGFIMASLSKKRG